MNNLIAIDGNGVVNVNSIISIGNPIMDKIRLKNKEVSAALEQVQDVKNTNMVESIDNILGKVNFDELKKLSENKYGRFKFFRFRWYKNSVIKKYKSISDQLTTIEATVTGWENSIKAVNEAMNTTKTDTITYQKELKDIISKFSEELESLDDPMIRLQSDNKLQDLIYFTDICDQIVMVTDNILNNNYTLYLKLISTYYNTLPAIQSQLNILTALDIHKNMIVPLQYIDQKKNEIIAFTSEESIRQTKESIDLMNKEDDFRVLRESVEKLKQASEDILASGKAQLNAIEIK